MQMNNDVLHEDIKDDTIDLGILYEKTPKMTMLEQVEKVSTPTAIPRDFHFIQTQDDGADLEGFDMSQAPIRDSFLFQQDKPPVSHLGQVLPENEEMRDIDTNI